MNKLYGGNGEMIKEIGLTILQLLILWIVYQLGCLASYLMSLPIPGNVLGVVILVALLVTGILPLSFVEKGADLLIKHLSFFFIPIAIGLINYGYLFLNLGLSLMFIITVSTLMGLYVTGFVSQFIINKGKEKHRNDYHSL